MTSGGSSTRGCLRATWLVTLACLAWACGSSPPQPPPFLSLQCPPPLEVVATDGIAANVTWAPTLRGGAPGASVACTPASGSPIPVGDSTVNCTATDSAGQAASCSFAVHVVAPPRLRYTRFVAFGDSITEGTVSPAPTLLVQLGTPQAYPGLLQAALAEKYSAQTIEVLNRGIGGERLNEGIERLPDVLDEDHPEVLLLLEGVNNIRNVPTSELASEYGSMIRIAQRRGATVLPALLTPISEEREGGRPGTQAAIRALNEEIRRISLDTGCGEPVDLYTAFVENPGLLGVDGLHPTEAGYVRIAELFQAAIEARWEEPPVPPPAVSVR